ncbi:hypothetical protein KO561_07200 [Radiobacillus kanasensis]|uniref:hypothetical protein n=1 Tax=Radiobacillus kanasensis TaxID=2844358 RepID=UPI001E460E00|nr:hypothetical protein [Radiobacillus kanasensis]UFU00714.1 hypothetical protein KO561_07200 [Radiobacillus kanasensis]
MRKIIFYLTPLVIIGVVLSGWSPGQSSKKEEVQSTINQINAHSKEAGVASESKNDQEIMSGIKSVVATLARLESTLVDNPDKVQRIKKQGKALEENWDVIEKLVEKSYPTDYKNIEESLYPLLSHSQKEKLEIDKMKGLVKATKTKLEDFRTKLSSK